LSKLWKLIPRGLRWRAVWAVSPHFVVGVSGIVVNGQGEILLARHVYRGEDTWLPPGGLIRYGESPPEALYREILEETSLEARVGSLLQVGIGESWPNVTFHFLCAVEGKPEPVVNGELFEARFFPPHVLPGLLDLEPESALAYALQVYRQPQESITTRIIETE
jgi:ADP-ribose pyrophosphatase YjhB (NUDIX family)